MMQNDFRMRTASLSDRLSERFALEQVEIESCGKYEELSFAVTADCRGQPIQRSQFNVWSETEDPLASRSDRGCILEAGAGYQNKRGSQCSFPPIRPCLVIVASTSTRARTATSAVMSEMS